MRTLISRNIWTALLILSFQILLVIPHTEVSAAKLRHIKYTTSDGTKLSAYLMRPKRRGRFPAIIALHGCSGLKKKNNTLLSRHKDWGERFTRWGYVVIFPDSHGSRKTPSLCTTRRRPVSQADRVRDTLGAYNWLR